MEQTELVYIEYTVTSGASSAWDLLKTIHTAAQCILHSQNRLFMSSNIGHIYDLLVTFTISSSILNFLS